MPQVLDPFPPLMQVLNGWVGRGQFESNAAIAIDAPQAGIHGRPSTAVQLPLLEASLCGFEQLRYLFHNLAVVEHSSRNLGLSLSQSLANLFERSHGAGGGITFEELVYRFHQRGGI